MAARGINRVVLLGRLGRDPEMRYTSSGSAVCSFSMATSERRKNKDGDYLESTEWHKVTVWGRLAENVGEYTHKGSQVYVEGKLQTRKWQDNNGNDRYTTEIIASEIIFLGNDIGSDSGDRQRHQSQSKPRQERREEPPPPEDEIPF